VEAKRRLDPNGTIDAELHQGTLSDAQWHSFSVNKSHGLRRSNEDKARVVQAALLHPHHHGKSDAAIAEHVGVHRDTVLKYRHILIRSGEQPANISGGLRLCDLAKTGRPLRTARDSNPRVKGCDQRLDGPGSSEPDESAQTVDGSDTHPCDGIKERDLPKTNKSKWQSGHESNPDRGLNEGAGSSDLPETDKSTRRTGRDGRTIDTAKIGRSHHRNRQKPRSPAEFAQARRDGYRGRLTSDVKLTLPNNHVYNCAFDLLRHFTFEYLQKVFQEIVNIHQQQSQKEAS